MADGRCADLEALDLARVLHPNTNLAALHRGEPLVLVRGKGVQVYDNHGGIHRGHGRALVHDARLRRRGARAHGSRADQEPIFLAFSSRATATPGILLADKLVGVAPCAASRVFFGQSGSDANDTQIKLVWYYKNSLGSPKKKKIIARPHAYHGTTLCCGRPDGVTVVSQALRCAVAAVPAHGCALLLPWSTALAKARTTTQRGSRRVSSN